VLYYHEKEFYPNGFKVTALFQNETPVRVHTEVKEKNYLRQQRKGRYDVVYDSCSSERRRLLRVIIIVGSMEPLTT
jgi:hypothetical protein